MSSEVPAVFSSFLHQEIGRTVNSKCIYTFRDHWSGKRGREAFYAATTQTSIVCGYFEYAHVINWLFRVRFKTWNHQFRSIEMATDRNLFEILGLNAAVVFEPEKWKADIAKDSGNPFLYLHVGEHEKMFDESAVRESHVVNKFTRQLEERVTRIIKDVNAADSLIGNSEA